MPSLKKGLLLFIVIAVLIVLARVAYTQYCASKVGGCNEEAYEDNYLSDDHMDN
jgi:flagellar basal body-associated protein FliL